ncbi:isocitrate/isopropylmalate dehydrogenase family protein [Candidatus Thorarchaeota archaeon]|jgi:3-isopropylmalate dehydrogenase|nr:MAG: isocitrate/isopropylmalate dehydrogenase family protein [Candidatus Thorarchaeota archaeon]
MMPAETWVGSGVTRWDTVPDSYRIAVLPGDGIGREVVPQTLRVLHRVTSDFGLSLDFHEFECGGQYYQEQGREWSQEAESFVMNEADAILLGGIGALDTAGNPVRLPDGALAGHNVLMGLRQRLDLYANVRPIKLFEGVPTPLAAKTPKDIDMVIVRENTEGLYTPARGRVSRKGKPDIAIDMRVISGKKSERVTRFAFELAMKRDGAPADGTKRVTCVDKSNVLVGCQLFRESYDKVSREYPEVSTDYCYVDAWTLHALQRPEFYDVVVAPNAFGDIISDLGGAIQGGLGIAPSGNIGEERAMFEPVHGSAPDIAGKGQANPIACIRSGAMMLEWLGDRSKDKDLHDASHAITRGVEENLAAGRIRTPDLCKSKWAKVPPSDTETVTSDIVQRLRR